MKKTSKLVEIIKETVREVVREELQAVLGKKPLTKENIEHGMSLVKNGKQWETRSSIGQTQDQA